ncbi:heme-binding protein [Kiloniella laminariae]|uniref:Heme-binding protein n=1 Tax=Kiloniella laminariae TaxID=454162 RepID=A0ABT4LPB7_9PROT|nr:heme-binding protein [Kiloniella laminariae]MCZ4282941.1 heme-binding protein [Kiloniella laminariae]
MSNTSILKFSRNFGATALASMIFLSGLSSVQAAELPSSPYLPLELAQKAADAAMAQCIADGFNVSVAVVERSGATKVLIKGDNSGPHTVGSSTGKAFTAASMGRNTLDLANFLKEHRELDGLRDMDPRMVILGGGLPIKINGVLVGGIGVGGAPGGDKDQVCAKAGLDSIGAE